MKATSLKTAAVLAGSISLLAGNAMAQTTTGVVGYETVGYGAGFTPIGLRLHEQPTVNEGTLETVNPTSVVDDQIDLGALMDGSTFILEIEDGSGIIQEVTSSDGGTGLAVADLTGVANGVGYSLRPAATLSSVFGAANEAGLTAGNGGPGGADTILLPNGAGGYDTYYFDNTAPPTFATASWAIADDSAFGGTAVDGAAIDLVYADGIVMNTGAAGEIVVTGDLKSGPTELNLLASFNVVSSIAPVGATLETAFAGGAGLAAGAGGPGAGDELWLPDGAGGYNKYYWDNTAPPTFLAASWAIVDDSAFGATAVDGTTVSLTSGIVMVMKNAGDVVQDVPGFYAGL